MFIGGPGTDKTRLATAIAVSGIALQGKRVRFYSTVDLVSVLAREKHDGKAGRIARSLMRMNLAILDEPGYPPFSQAGGALLFHLLPELYEHTSVAITTNPSPRRSLATLGKTDCLRWRKYLRSNSMPTGWCSQRAARLQALASAAKRCPGWDG